MPVGNDVIDLGHPQCQPAAIHPRFDSRAFSPYEIAVLTASEHTHRTRWSIWAAKESAFKAARQLDPHVRFIPREFAVRLSGERAEVTHPSGRFEVRFDHADRYVHAMASRVGEKPGFRVDECPHGDAEDPSGRVRTLAQAALGTLLHVAPEEIQIVTPDRVPAARRLGTLLPFDLSLSHDGDFVACAWAKKGTDLFFAEK